MSQPFIPKLEILHASQRRLWAEFVDVPKEFMLYGGTALALHLGHRESVDFDFFGTDPFDSDILLQTVPFLAEATVIQKSPNTLTVIVDRGDPVQVSFFGVPKVTRLRAGVIAQENGIRVASVIDLAGTKVSVVQKRAEVKDYIDIDAMLHAGVVDLPSALSAGQAIYGKQFNPQLTLKSLCYFDDGNVHTLSADARQRLIDAVQAVDLSQLPNIRQIENQIDPENER